MAVTLEGIICEELTLALSARDILCCVTGELLDIRTFNQSGSRTLMADSAADAQSMRFSAGIMLNMVRTTTPEPPQLAQPVQPTISPRTRSGPSMNGYRP